MKDLKVGVRREKNNPQKNKWDKDVIFLKLKLNIETVGQKGLIKRRTIKNWRRLGGGCACECRMASQTTGGFLLGERSNWTTLFCKLIFQLYHKMIASRFAVRKSSFTGGFNRSYRHNQKCAESDRPLLSVLLNRSFYFLFFFWLSFQPAGSWGIKGSRWASSLMGCWLASLGNLLSNAQI